MMKQLTIDRLKTAAREFVKSLSSRDIPSLFGTTDGKAVGTFVEHALHSFLRRRFRYEAGGSASGIDFPRLEVDLKVTSYRQPQSSCPFKNAGQKVYGLGYHLLVLVYNKSDRRKARVANLKFTAAVFVDRTRTADYQTTSGLLGILARRGNRDDVVAFLEERNLPLDEIGRDGLAKRILKQHPVQGYLTISNALQWRLQYARVLSLAAEATSEGVEGLLG